MTSHDRSCISSTSSVFLQNCDWNCYPASVTGTKGPVITSHGPVQFQLFSSHSNWTFKHYLQFCRYADKGDALSDLGECSKFLITEIVTGGVLGSETSHKVIRAIRVVILIIASNRLSASPNRRETGRCRFSRKEFADVVSISSWYRSWVAVSASLYR